MQDFRFRGKGLSVWAGKVVGRGSQTFKADPQGTWVSCRRDGLRRCACRAVIECEPYFRPAVLQKMQRFVLTFLCGGSALGRGSDFAILARKGPKTDSATSDKSAPVVAEHVLFSERIGSPCEPRSDVREPRPTKC
jgi:hypothetical protein